MSCHYHKQCSEQVTKATNDIIWQTCKKSEYINKEGEHWYKLTSMSSAGSWWWLGGLLDRGGMLGSWEAVWSCTEVLDAVRVTGGKLLLPGLGAEIWEEGGVGPWKLVPLITEWGRLTHVLLAGGVLPDLWAGGLSTSVLIFLVGGVSAK